MEELTVYPNKLKMALTLVGALAFVAVCGFALTREGPSPNRGIAVAIALTGIALFGLCACYLIYRLIDSSPAIVLNQHGVFDNASLANAGLIGWEEIEAIYVYAVGKNKMLAIIPTDTEALLARQAPFKQKLMRVNWKLAGAAVNVPQIGLSMPVEQLLDYIDQYRSFYLGTALAGSDEL